MAATPIDHYRALVKLGFPARYPLVQFPNPPLMVALLASVVGWFVSGTVQDYATAIGTMGIVVWAYQEAVEGVNLFRHAAEYIPFVLHHFASCSIVLTVFLVVRTWVVVNKVSAQIARQGGPAPARRNFQTRLSRTRVPLG